MSTLEFTKNEDGSCTKEAIGMYSKENEYVVFKDPFMCTGQVRMFKIHPSHHVIICQITLLFKKSKSLNFRPKNSWNSIHEN